MRLSVSGKCENKDSVWRILQKEVLYGVVLRVFKLGTNCRRRYYTVVGLVLMRDGRGAVRLSHIWGGCVREFSPPEGGAGGLPSGKF